MKTVLISSPHLLPWQRQFPGGEAVWDGWRFIFNATAENYDYLVAYDDLHAPVTLKCPAENTIHVATEPPVVHRYQGPFLAQFGTVIAHDKSVQHPNAIFHQSGLSWCLGQSAGSTSPASALSFKQLIQLFDLPKTKMISVIASDKAFTTSHKKRLAFAKKLKAHFGEQIDFFGRGFVEMNDKLEALQEYRFNVVLENSIVDHYFTEKFTDCVIAGTYPIYWGCPNLETYFPKNSFARIDITDFEASIKTIETAIRGNYDKQFRSQLRTARDLSMHQHNFFPMIIQTIKSIEDGTDHNRTPVVLFGALILPFRHPIYTRLFESNRNRKTRGKLSQLADTNPIIGLPRKIPRAAKRFKFSND